MNEREWKEFSMNQMRWFLFLDLFSSNIHVNPSASTTFGDPKTIPMKFYARVYLNWNYVPSNLNVLNSSYYDIFIFDLMLNDRFGLLGGDEIVGRLREITNWKSKIRSNPKIENWDRLETDEEAEESLIHLNQGKMRRVFESLAITVIIFFQSWNHKLPKITSTPGITPFSHINLL